MAADADRIPLLRAWLVIRVPDERIIAQYPFLLGHQPGERKPDLPIAMSGRNPEHFEMMRAGDHFHRDSIRSRRRSVRTLCSLKLLDPLNVSPVTVPGLMQTEARSAGLHDCPLKDRLHGVG